MSGSNQVREVRGVIRLAGKVYIITGGGKGIGAATALEFVRGAFVEIGDTDSAAMEQTARDIERVPSSICHPALQRPAY